MLCVKRRDEVCTFGGDQDVDYCKESVLMRQVIVRLMYITGRLIDDASWCSMELLSGLRRHG